MFYLIALLGIVLMLGWVVLDRAVFAPERAEIARQQTADARRLGWIEVGLYLLMMIGFLTLAITGFIDYLRTGHLDGWLLIVHMMGAGLYVTVLPLFMLALAAAARLDRQGPDEPLVMPEKILFWLGNTAGWVSLASIVLTMLKLFDTHTMKTLMTVHAYSGLAMVVLLIPHVYIIVESRGERMPRRGAGSPTSKTSGAETQPQA